MIGAVEQKIFFHCETPRDLEEREAMLIFLPGVIAWRVQLFLPGEELKRCDFVCVCEHFMETPKTTVKSLC